MPTPDDNPIYVAIDHPDVNLAMALSAALQGAVGGLKLGLEFFCAAGPGGVAKVVEAGNLPLFLDLKLHDIPNTVAGAVRSVLPLSPSLLTIHAAGGPAMIEAAAAAATTGGRQRPKILAVTVLTSLDQQDLNAVGQDPDPAAQVLRLATMAQQNGADGAVCSPLEVASLRAALGPDFLLVVPGIRPAGSAIGDQKRVMTPADALAAGASHLVIGRPITAATDPTAAARAMSESL